MSRTLEMFPLLDVPKKPRQKLMHVVDAGDMVCQMACKRCGYESGWVTFTSVAQVKRGYPCPTCNKAEDDKGEA